MGGSRIRKEFYSSAWFICKYLDNVNLFLKRYIFFPSLLQTLSNPVKYQFLIADPEEFKSVASLYENRYDQMLNYKSCNLEMDISSKRGHLRYQSIFYPDASLEFIFQWVVCTGPLVAELLQNWLRKAQNCGVNLVPIPCDPFALPMSHKADPLRAPIFVPLNISALNMNGKTFLEEYPQDSWPQRLLLFQVSIKILYSPKRMLIAD
jgi:hypothetical protein